MLRSYNVFTLQSATIRLQVENRMVKDSDLCFLILK